MKQVLGILGLLLVVFVATALIDPKFVTGYNLQNLVRWTSFFAILGVGVAFVIVSGGIDLSIGSVVGLSGVLVPLLLARDVPVVLAVLIALGSGGLIGWVHGILVTKLRLQPFVVTLCGLLVYRGVARWLAQDRVQGFGNEHPELRSWAIGSVPIPGVDFAIPYPFFLLVGVAIVAHCLLDRTLFGRYLHAVGKNERAARYSGLPTDRVVIGAYVICSGLAAFGGVLFALDGNSVQPAGQGNFYELYAIAAAVLGGCSLRGGEGTVLGVIIGAATLRVLYNAINILGIPTQLEFAVIGFVLLAGAMADQLVRRWNQRRLHRSPGSTGGGAPS